MTLEDWLFKALTRKNHIHRLHAFINSKGQVAFYIHPLGDTHTIADCVVEGNTIKPNPDMQHAREFEWQRRRRMRRKKQ